MTQYGEIQPGKGLLGRTDARGMKQRQDKLWVSGEIDLVAFGHTHVFVDGNFNPPHGLPSARRSFNTGSWMPSIPIGEYETPSWSELGSMVRTHDVRYLVIKFTDPPQGELKSL